MEQTEHTLFTCIIELSVLPGGAVRWQSELERWTGDRVVLVRIPLQKLRFGSLAIRFATMSFGGDTKSCQALLVDNGHDFLFLVLRSQNGKQMMVYMFNKSLLCGCHVKVVLALFCYSQLNWFKTVVVRI